MESITILGTVASILLGGGILTFIQFLISRSDTRAEKNSDVLKAISALDKKVDERFTTLDKKIERVDSKAEEYNAVNCRVRILRFEDELQANQRHSKDAWDQVMSGDIDTYENYCSQHPEFKNNITISTIEHIKHGYNDRLEKHDWSY